MEGTGPLNIPVWTTLLIIVHVWNIINVYMQSYSQNA